MNDLTLRIKFDPPPIPDCSADWQGWIDGLEETTSVTGPTASEVAKQLAERVFDMELRYMAEEEGG